MKLFLKRLLNILLLILKSILYLAPIVLIVFLYLFVATFNDMNDSLRCWLYYGDLIVANILILIGDALNQDKLEKNTNIFSNFGIITIQVISLLLFISKYHFPQFDKYWIFFVLILYFVIGMLIVSSLILNGKEMKLSKSFIKSTFFYVFGDLLYISLFKFEIQYSIIFGSITFILALTSIVKVFVSGKKIDVFFIIDCFMALIILVITIWKLPIENNLQTIVLQLLAALLGGIITMIGVVLTIKSTEKQRKDERKEQLKPVIFINSINNVKGLILSQRDTYFNNGVDLCFTNDKLCSLDDFVVQNSDASYPIIHGIVINHQYLYRFKNPLVLSKNQNVIFSFKNSISFDSKEIINLSLCTSDVNSKDYYLLELKYKKCNICTYTITGFDGYNREIRIINETDNSIETVSFIDWD